MFLISGATGTPASTSIFEYHKTPLRHQVQLSTVLSSASCSLRIPWTDIFDRVPHQKWIGSRCLLFIWQRKGGLTSSIL